MNKVRIVKSKVMADTLVWIGFEYSKDDDGNFVFIRSSRFDMAWKDLHALRALYYKRDNK